MFNYGLISIMIVNALIVLCIHLNWEAKATLKFKKELLYIKNKNVAIKISPKGFKKSIEERLQLLDIKYKIISNWHMKKEKHKEYFSNVPIGYPGAIPYIQTDEIK